MNDPTELLERWIEEAGGLNCQNAVAMALATSDAQARPSARIVLLRGLDERGLRFYTSYESRKGRELRANPLAAAILYWPLLQRQVRVEGSIQVLSEEESDAYFQSRPRGHRLAAWASEQSEPIDSEDILIQRFEHFEQRFEGEDVPRPHSWGGYLLTPSTFEFWQSRANRLHSRVLYRRVELHWQSTILSP